MWYNPQRLLFPKGSYEKMFCQIPPNAILVTKEGLASASECWEECTNTYKKSEDGTTCEPKESSIIAFSVLNLQDISNGKKGLNSRTLSLGMKGANVYGWYVTHNGNFRPTHISDTEGVGHNWSSSSKPTIYTVPADGEYTLYLWVADVEGSVTQDVTQDPPASLSFRVDSTPPVLAFSSQPSARGTATTAEFQLSVTDDTDVTLSYCLDRACSAGAGVGAGVGAGADAGVGADAGAGAGLGGSEIFTSVQSQDFSLSLSALSPGEHEITFKAEDELRHSAQISYTWIIVEGGNPGNPGDATRAGNNDDTHDAQ